MRLLIDFLIFCLLHAKRKTIPAGAQFVCDSALIGSDGEWEYLFGSTGWKITKALLDLKYKEYYSKHGWTREEYDKATKDWIGRVACDCNGLLDFFLSVDMNADYDYRVWCKGHNGAIQTGFVPALGMALFRKSKTSEKMVHVGWCVGVAEDGEMLVVEEKGLRYGCVISRYSDGAWTHYGYPAAVLDCSAEIKLWEPEPVPTEPVVFALTSPIQKGDDVKRLQVFLNSIGYTDDSGNTLDEDGKLGKRTWQALTAFVGAHSAPVDAPALRRLDVVLDGETLLSATV